MADLWGESASLLSGANSAAASANQNDIARQKNQNELFLGGQNNLTQLMQRVIADQSAKQREGMQQAGATQREGMQQAGATERQKMIIDSGQITFTEPMANALAKRTGDKSWLKMVGDKLPGDKGLAMVAASYEEAKQNPTYKKIQKGDKSIQVQIWPDGSVIELPGTEGEERPRAPKNGGKSEQEKLSEDLLKHEKAIAATNSKLLGEIKRGKLPDEAFGGKPGDIRSLAQAISSGKLGNLDAEQQARVNLIKGLMQTAKEQNDAYNEMRVKAGKKPSDLTGFGDAAPSAENDRVKVKSPQGQVGTIPRSQLQEAIKNGYSEVS